MKRRINVLVILVCGLLINLAACDRSKTTEKKVMRPVKTMLIASKAKGIERNFPGKVLPSQQAELSFQVSGEIINLPVKKGDKVIKGTLLAQLKADEYQDEVDKELAKFRLAQAQHKRGEALIKNNYIAQADLEKLRYRYEAAKADLSKANRDLKDTNLYASFDGVISNTFVEQFERVKAKQKIMNLHNVEKLDVEINVPENVILTIEKVKEQNIDVKPVVTFDTFPDKQFPLELKEFSSEADKNTQTYTVIYSMPQPKELNVLPGMSVMVKATLPSAKADGQYYLIPSSAVFKDSKNQTVVWVINPSDNTVKKIQVKVHRLTTHKIQVLSGLKPGDRIVTTGVHFLRENQKIKSL